MKRILFFLSAIFLATPPLLVADPLRVGVIQSTSGIAAEDGKTVVQALQLANKHLGEKIELLIEDDQTSAKNAVSSYNALKARGAEVIIGATWDFTTNALIPLAARDKIVLFNTSTLPEAISLNESDGFAFTNAVSTYEEAAPFSRFIRAKTNQSIVTVYANNSWGETQRKVYQKIAKDAGLKILGEYSSVAFDQNEWRNVLPTIKSKNPSFVLLLLNKNDLQIFLKRASELSFTPEIFASKNALDAFSATDNKSLYHGLCFTYPFEQLQRNNDFLSAYYQSFEEKPRIYADNSYDALFILSRAQEIADLRDISLREALQDVEIVGLVGSYRYSNEHSFSLGRASLMCVDKDEAKLIK